jgi:hypothetical protein
VSLFIQAGKRLSDEMRRLVCLTHDDGYNDGVVPERMIPLVLGLASEPQIMKAFRSTARMVVWHSNLANMPTMTFLLRKAEEVAASHPSLQQRIADSDSEY